MIQVIPLSNIPNQQFNIVLGEQNCTIKVYQRGEYLYADLLVDNVVIREGMICLVDINIISYPVNGFKGIIFFSDLTGMGGTPNYEYLGTRFVMCYDAEVSG